MILGIFVVIDLETTGHSPVTGDTIIDVGIIVIKDNEIIDDYSTLLNPNKPIPPFISNLTGIIDKDVVDAPNFHEKANEIVRLFDDGYLVAHNVDFDLGFLNEELANNNFDVLKNPVLDTVELARILYPQAPGYQLGQLADYFEIKHEQPHRALSDAYVTAKLFLILKAKLESLPYETINHLLRLESKLHSDVYQLLYKQQQALAFSTTEKNNLVAYRGIAFKNIDVKFDDKSVETTSFGDYLDSIYETNGTMEQQMNGYEKREGQREMSENIFDAFQSKEHALIEAETGTGKTLAYLIPAIYEAAHTEQRILISTYTTQLQSQLLEEEIPLIRKLLSFPFTVALLKGKGHYISLEKFERELTSNQEDNYDIILTKAMILVWLTETETGDIDEIQLSTSGYFFYKSISTDAEGYVNPDSPWFSRSYYQKARIQAEQANLIITNHALLCTDIFNSYNFLPAYDKIIIDEAHHLENTVSRHHGLKLDYVNIQYSLNKIGTTIDGNWLNKALEKHSFQENSIQFKGWNNTFLHTKQEVDDLFRTLFEYVIQQKRQDKTLSDTGRTQYHFEEDKEVATKWRVIKEMAKRFTIHLSDLLRMLGILDIYLTNQDYPDKHMQDELQSNKLLLQTFIDHIDQLFLQKASISQTKWIEIEAYGAKNAVYLYSEPTDISTLLTEKFFNEKSSVVLTSATLTMKDSFSFIQNRLGLPSEGLFTNKLASPFSYDDQVQLLIPDDFPAIIHNDLDEYIYATCEAILSLASITKGRMLVLFTSYDMLRRSYAILKETMDLDEYFLIAQGISSGSRTRLKKNFQTFEKAILLGTSSFWEGVDIPGDDLSCLIIARLPFEPPNHPIYEAKAAHLKELGKSAFFELALPAAVIRFKQGFGRLIRSTNDRGIIFICDARIMTANYGNFFIDSIPTIPITYDSTHELIKRAEKWF